MAPGGDPKSGRIGLCARLFGVAAALLLVAGLSAAPTAAEMASATLAGASPATSAGETPATSPGEFNLEDIDSLVALIEDPEARAVFVARLRAMAAAKRGVEAAETANAAEEIADGLLAGLSERVRAASTRVVAAAGVILDAPKLVAWLSGQLSNAATRARWIDGLWRILLVIALGLVGEWLASWLLARPRRAVEGLESDTVLLRLPFLVARTILDLIPIAVFAGGAYGALSLVDAGKAATLLALTIVNALLVVRAALALARALLVPRAPSLRVLDLGNLTAAYLFVWVRRLVTVGVYGAFALEAAPLLGLPAPAHAIFLILLGLIIAVMLIALVMQNRRPVASWLRGGQEADSEEDVPSASQSPGRSARTSPGISSLRGRFADIWHVLAVLYLVASYLVWALDMEGGFEFLLRATLLSALVLIVATLAAIGVRRMVRRIFTISADLKSTYPMLEDRANRYLPAIQTVLRAVIVAFAAVAILQAWGIDAFGWLAGPSGRRVVSGALTIAIILVAALLFWEVVSSAIERYLGQLDHDQHVGGSARVRTLLPLARKAILVVLIVLVALVVLSELGINIAPLLAGAGVIGLAIGFGAQTLVKDIITGLFILIEDAVAIGDIVDVAGHVGVVEGLSIRSIRLRDIAGTVHTVPFSEVTTVRNMSKDYSYALIDAGVSYREDVDEVIGVLEEVGETARADADLADSIIEPLEVMGVNELADSAVIVRVRLKTLPGKQYMVRRGFYRLMKQAFDERGIEIPFPHTTLYFGEDKEGNAPAANLRVAGEAEAAKLASAPARKKKPAAKTGTAPPGDMADMDGE
jgi:small conductance mechanosensitive channel